MKDWQDLTPSGPSDATLLEQLLAREHRPNVLVECGATPVRAVSNALRGSCRQPHKHYRLPCPLDLSAPAQGTLLLENVEALTATQQEALHEWMTKACLETQVVSITSKPLARWVERGEFLESLFYRLNVVLIDETAASTLRESRFGRTLSACSAPSTPHWPASSLPPAR